MLIALSLSNCEYKIKTFRTFIQHFLIKNINKCHICLKYYKLVSTCDCCGAL